MAGFSSDGRAAGWSDIHRCIVSTHSQECGRSSSDSSASCLSPRGSESGDFSVGYLSATRDGGIKFFIFGYLRHAPRHSTAVERVEEMSALFAGRRAIARQRDCGKSVRPFFDPYLVLGLYEISQALDPA